MMNRLKGLIQDVRFGARVLRKTPGFAAITILTLALGIAGNVVIFSFFNSFYLRPFPFVDPRRLVDLDETAPQWNARYLGLAYPHFNEWREQNRSFAGMAAWGYEQYNVAFQGSTTRVRGARVTHDLASVLGFQPILGRMFTSDEDQPGGAKVVVLGNGFWKRQFGGQEDVVGQTLRLNGNPYKIIGVLPPDNEVLVEAEFWVPLAENPSVGHGWIYRGVGRLKEGVTLDMAREDLMRVRQGMLEENRGDPSSLPSISSLSDRFFGSSRWVIEILLAAVGVVLLIACGNVAALMLARGLARARELGVRLSLGATLPRLAGLIGAESLMLTVLGGLLGMLLGHWGSKVLLNSLTDRPPRWVNFDLDWRVWVFAGLMVAVSALLGALPVIASAAKLDLHRALQSSAQQSTTAGGGRRLLQALVVGEVALTLVLLVEAGLLLQTFRALQQAVPGYRADHVLIYEIALPADQYESKESKLAFFRNHLERLRSVAGVVSASEISAPPLGGHWGVFFTAADALPKTPDKPDCIVLQRVASPGYLETMGVRLVAGRDFTRQDGVNESSRAIIVNESFAHHFWPGQNPLGRRLRHHGDTEPWMTVVGVARDVQHYEVGAAMIPGVYVPYAQMPINQMAIVVRTSIEPTLLVPTVRALVREADPNLAVFGVRTMAGTLRQSIWMRRVIASLFGIFGFVALVMALGGIYGVFSYAVNRRTQELGVRLALGARRRDVLWLVVRQGLLLAVIGIGIGLVGALMIVPVTGGLFYGVGPFDLLTFGGVSFLLAAVAVVACWIPAHRATRGNPMMALRCE